MGFMEEELFLLEGVHGIIYSLFEVSDGIIVVSDRV
jgi:hypothetical protein